MIALAVGLFVLLKVENQKRERLPLEEKEAERITFDDLTEKENLHFRYVYKAVGSTMNSGGQGNLFSQLSELSNK